VNEQEQVEQFHRKHGFDVGVEMIDPRLTIGYLEAVQAELIMASRTLYAISQLWENGTTNRTIDNHPGETHDPRLMRAHLIVEEVSELLLAMAEEDEVEVLDALTDLLYVTYGSGVAFDLPLHEAFAEVQRSNMTKAVGAGGDKDMRCRNKGDSYEPPTLGRILEKHRVDQRDGRKRPNADSRR